MFICLLDDPDGAEIVSSIQHTLHENDSDTDEEETEDELDQEHLNPGGIETLVADNEETVYNRVLKMAPAEGLRPLCILYDKNCDIKSFPKVYAGQLRNFKTDIRVTYTDIAKSEARMYDRRACYPTKLLHSCKMSQIHQVSNSISLCLRKKNLPRNINAGNLQKEEYLQQLISHDDGYHCLKEIRGSPAYFQDQQKKVMAMIRQLGLPTFFITLSAAETKWPELLVNLEKILNQKDVTNEEALNMSFLEKSKLIQSDPITCARNFEHRYRSLLTNLLEKKGGIFEPNPVIDYYHRIEFQHRGSPHSHGLYWVEGAPRYPINDDSDLAKIRENNCIRYIDSFITTKRYVNDGDDEIRALLQYQLHKHTKSCKDKNKKCRYGFPLPPMHETTILCPHPIKYYNMENAKRNFALIQHKLTEYGRNFTEDIPFTEFLQSISMTYDQYIEAVQTSIKRPKVFLKRSTNAIYINGYNEKLLRAWKANIDIQYIIDPYACVKYCVNYISKAGGGVSKVLKLVTEQVKSGDLSLQEQLRKYGNAFLNSVEVSAQEAAFFILGLPYTMCSRECVFINTGDPEKRVLLVKPIEKLNELPPQSTDVTMTNLLDQYADRSLQLSDVCLAEFAAYYTIKNDKITKRAYPRIIRYRRYTKSQDYHNYCREQIMLYVPWRDEEAEVINASVEEIYQREYAKIVETRKAYVFNSELEEFESLKEPTENDDNTLSETRIPEDIEFDNYDIENSGANITFTQPRVEYLPPLKLIDEENYLKIIRSLNEKQQKYFLHIIHNLKQEDSRFYEFVSGGAGVGKSHLITAVVQTLLRYYYKIPGIEPDHIFILVCAATGKAAYNVHGVTLHSAFRLPLTGNNMARLEDSTCNTIRTKMLDLKLIIIDEISMTSVKQLYQIDTRLKQIFQSLEPFGGIPMLVVGDFFQIRPVMGQFVFEIPKYDVSSQLIGNTLWNLFKMYELTEVMRQKDDFYFATALNRMAAGCMTDADIELMKSRELSATLKPPNDCIRLFFTNKECQEYNDAVYSRLESEAAVSFAVDMVHGATSEQERTNILEYAKSLSTSDADGIPYQVKLKVGATYMVPINIDVADGIFNGTTGILQHIEYATTAEGIEIPIRAYLDFQDPMIGSSIRTKYRAHQQALNIQPHLTPIGLKKKVLSKSFTQNNVQIIRRQIPLIAADGITINKAQGSSFKKVVVRVTKQLRRDLLYVGCSRSFTLDGLYIDGEFEPPKQPQLCITNELNRLKANPIQLSIKFLQDFSKDDLKIVFHNVQSLHKHALDVASEKSFMAADAMLFVETWSLPSDTYKFKKFKCKFREDSERKRSSYGSMIFCKRRTRQIISDITFQSYPSGAGHVDYTTFQINDVTFIMIYRSPKSSPKYFRKTLQEQLTQHNSAKLVVLGDINIDQNCRRKIFALLSLSSLVSMIPLDQASTDYGSNIDICYSNMKNMDAWFYESIFSYHKPICMVWKDFFKQHTE